MNGMHTLGKCEWEDIEVDEVFACDGCWNILVKMDEEGSILLTEDHDLLNFKEEVGDTFNLEGFDPDNNKINLENRNRCIYGNLYKLPLEFQRYWNHNL